MSAAPETLPVPAASMTHDPTSTTSVSSPPAAVPLPPRRTKHIVHWFRKGLRLHDNPALREALKDALTFRCVFIIDPWFASSSNVGINKWRFLLQCLEDLDASLKKLNSRLFVVRGQPADALPKLFRDWGTTTLSFEEDPEPYGRVRDHNITTKCREVGINVVSQVSHTLYKLDSIIEMNGGKAPLTYHQFQALIASMPPPPQAEATISVQTLDGAVTPISEDHNDRFGVPTLEELGFDTEKLKAPVWVGGESEALARLERHLERKAWVASFGRPKMTPQSLLASQTGLSPYLRFGCLSTRLFYYQLTELYKRVKRVRPPLSLHGQILWREFFYCAATRNPNFDRMEGNPICVQIPWEKNQDALLKWTNGQTGFPWIDSIMIQLREEGWIHHLARHAVACFLTRGDLWISWEEGMKVFDELLLDADWSVNAGMWMWLSCSSFFQQFFHCYCPVRFGRKTDPNGDFIRRYIPALKSMPTRYIHEPWVAPESVQVSARCIVGRDYPLPMVDHSKASHLNIERIKQVYAQLAKFRPGNVNPNPVTRPNTMLSSPSPTSIMWSINQSNFLCSQAPEPATTPSPTSIMWSINQSNFLCSQAPEPATTPSPTSIIRSINQSNFLCSQAPEPATTPKVISYKEENDLFTHPGKTNTEANKQPQTKHVFIIPKPEKLSTTAEKISACPKRQQCPPPQNTYQQQTLNVSYKGTSKIEIPVPVKDKYDFKSTIMNNYVAQNFASPRTIIQVEHLARKEIVYAQKEVKFNAYDDGKVQFYMSALSENGIRVQNGYIHKEIVQHGYIRAPLSHDYSSKSSTETPKDQQTTEGTRTITHTDQSFPHGTDKQTSSEIYENKDN